jgi:hypothetical protein
MSRPAYRYAQRTWRDIVPFCPAVTHWLFMKSKVRRQCFSGLTPQVPAAVCSCLVL